MSDWAAKRFWTDVEVMQADGGWCVALDTRQVRTPAKAPLILPSRAMADAVAAEWAAQEGEIKPMTMPCTRSANAALDKVALQRNEVAQMLADYGETDLLCHRAEGPMELVARQAESWDPILAWGESDLGVRLARTKGVMPVAQPPDSLARLLALFRAADDFQMAALHDLVSISGSAILGLAAARGAWPVESIWRASRIDEDWQIEQWGRDEEAEADTATRQAAFLHAYRFNQLATA